MSVKTPMGEPVAVCHALAASERPGQAWGDMGQSYLRWDWDGVELGVG